MKLRWRPVLWALILGIPILLPRPSAAQFNQYVEPGEFDLRREPQQELLKEAIDEARWKLGPFYLDPWLSLRDVAYIDNVGRASDADEKRSDVTAKLGLGIQGYTPIASEVTFAFHALPEYSWWADLAGRRKWNGHYGAGFFGDLGRAGFEATITRVDDAVFFSRELEVPVNTREDRVDLKLEVELFGPVSLYLAGYGRSLAYEDDPQDDTLFGVDQLNRDEAVYLAGLQVDLGRGLELGVGAEFSDVDFEKEEFDRSNDGTSPILSLDFRGERFNLQSEFAFRDLQPKAGSSFVPYDDVTGRALISFAPTGRSEFQLFWNSNLVYTRNPRWVYFQDESVGAAFLTSLGSSSSVRVFYETGDNRYTTFGDGINDRTDDFDAWGVNFRFNIGPILLNLGATKTDYTSNQPQFDRDVTIFKTGLSFKNSGRFPWT